MVEEKPERTIKVIIVLFLNLCYVIDGKNWNLIWIYLCCDCIIFTLRFGEITEYDVIINTILSKLICNKIMP